MDSRSRRGEDVLPLVGGDAGDVGTRLRAELHVRRTVTVLTVHGEIDAYTRNRWRHILDGALRTAEEYGRLVVDVGDAEFIGCRPVLDLARSAQQGVARGVEITVIDPQPSVLDRIVTITGLTEWLPVYTDPAQMLSEAPTRPSTCTPAKPTVRTPRAS
ncbi:anti-sigma factor antagonist [Nocardia fluminea]|uniref:anti-sigma factor antagonist n=1 Tax=Nocardia fluminea TaxID=134984 RepID=UPI003819569D